MKKIMFNERYGLTKAVLERHKTMTRRIVPQSTIDKYALLEDPTIIDDARYEVGEVIAIAQSYRDVAQGGYPIDSRYDAFRAANWRNNEDGALKRSAGWSNKMFVRADLMPRHIWITYVKAERLQDISDEDCIKEGIDKWTAQGKRYYGFFDYVKNKFSHYRKPREAYAALIDKVSGKGTWESNPYVFVYEFGLMD